MIYWPTKEEKSLQQSILQEALSLNIINKINQYLVEPFSKTKKMLIECNAYYFQYQDHLQYKAEKYLEYNKEDGSLKIETEQKDYFQHYFSTFKKSDSLYR